MNNSRKLYFSALENTISNNIHASQVYPIINRTSNMKGLFLNPFFEVSRSRIGLISFKKKLDSKFKIFRLPIATYFIFSPWYFFPIIFIILSIYLFFHFLFNRYDIVHCRHFLAGLVAIPIAKIFSIKVLTDIRGCYTDEGVLIGRWKNNSFSYKFYKKLEKFVYKFSDNVCGISPSMCDYIKSISPLTNPIYIPAIVDTERIFFNENLRSEARRALKLSKDDLCFIYIGSISPWNSIDALIDQLKLTVHKLGAKDEKIYFIFLSNDSKHFKTLEKLPYKILTKSVLPSEINFYLNAADYGLLPGKKIITESDKNVFKVMISSKAEEYLCCGLQVISNEGIEYFKNKKFSSFF